MVAWLNPIMEDDVSSLGDNSNQIDPLLMKHDLWLLSLSDVIYSQHKNAVLIVFMYFFIFYFLFVYCASAFSD